MKYILILAICIYSANAKFQCLQGKSTEGAELEPKDCRKAEETHCYRPRFIEYVGLNNSLDVNYACGKCGGETKDVTCEECTASGCNKPRKTAKDFLCYRYDYDEDRKKFNRTGTITCKRLAGTAAICNEPMRDATSNTYPAKDGMGCGPCKEPDTFNACVECTLKNLTMPCNSAMRVAVLFAPLLAVLVNLL